MMIRQGMYSVRIKVPCPTVPVGLRVGLPELRRQGLLLGLEEDLEGLPPGGGVQWITHQKSST